MKKRIISLLVLTMVLVLGFTFTGCSDDTADAADDTTNAEDVEADDAITAENVYADFADFESIDWAKIGKYKVDELYTETTQNGVYTLGYESNTSPDKILDYYDGMLIGSKNYLRKDIPTIGGMLKGTINGHGITISVQDDDSGELTIVEFYSYDASYVAE
jgi:hypothetical protein